jgi:squalene-hopene/tetraprenyl-beta-curcumene cyclase
VTAVDALDSRPGLPSDLVRDVTDAVRRGRDYLVGRQDPDGWWKGELRTNVTMDAEDLLLRQFLGILEPADLDAAARWIRSQQRADGSWSSYLGGPAELSTTVEAYVALRLAGDEPHEPHMSRARSVVHALGGLERSRVFTRIWLALFGEYPWDELPTMPPEIIRLPSWMPLNVYDWACWARQTVVPLTVVSTLRPVRRLPFSVDELRQGGRPPEKVPAKPFTVPWAFQQLDKVLHRYEAGQFKPGRETAIRRCIEWVLARQEADGCWGGIQPPWVYSILALHLTGYALDHPAVKAALDGLEGFVIREDTPDGPVRRFEACQSPVWDTCLALIALLDAGMPADDPAVRRATDWLLREQVTVPGDWSVRRPGLASAGWAFEFANDVYPDVDDTAEVVLALERVLAKPGAAPEGTDLAVERAVEWTVGMQSADGGWAAFDADNTRDAIRRLPFCDFGEVIDPPSADVTAHVIEMLGELGLGGTPAARRGIEWLLAAQEPDGSWFGRWGVNYVYGTGAAVPALVAAGMPTDAAPVRRAVRWLAAHQNPDGGWGEDLRSYTDDAWRGRGTSTASQTAWALMALLAAGEDDAVVRRGLRFLLDTQRPDGGWDEDLFTGTGFPGDFSINYEMYRYVFPLSALGRWLARSTP